MMGTCLGIKRVCAPSPNLKTVFRSCFVGNESYAIVEFAPYQKVPSEKKKPDARNATIEKGMSNLSSKRTYSLNRSIRIR
jgi:Smg-4/UPF3 family